MIKKLQKKFIMITMTSVFFIIFLLIGSINIINIYQMNHRINGAIKILSQNEGTFPKYDKGKPPRENFEFGFQLNEETPFETRYFIVKLNSDGSTREIDTSHIRAVSSADAREYAEEILESGKKSGFESIYKYEIVKQGYGYMVIFIDCRNSIQSVTVFLVISSVVALGITLLMFILVSVFSKKAITPIIASMEKQKQFITDAGHEIKTPLAIISANADVLELTGGESEWITSIRNQITRLDKLVKNLLMLSKMDEGNMKLSYVEFDISKTVEETAASFRAVAETLNKNFFIEIQEGLKLYGDESSIQQLVSTLVDNALKYSDSNGTVKVSLITYKKGIKLEVFNTTDMEKAVLSKESLSKLFDRFYRADSSRSRDTGGYGIGLSIAKSIVEAHHGRISARCEGETGICFQVIIG
jgi:signal transduction histidine kinase